MCAQPDKLLILALLLVPVVFSTIIVLVGWLATKREQRGRQSLARIESQRLDWVRVKETRRRDRLRHSA